MQLQHQQQGQQARFTASFIVHQNYRYIGAALHSLYANTRTPFQVVIVINTGKGTESDQLQAEFPQVQYLFNEMPLGFAANHNQVMHLTATDYAALLNDDIELHSGALDHMITYLDQHPRTAVTGAALLNADGTPQVSVYSDPILLRTLYRISPLASLTSQNSVLRRILLQIGIGRVLKVESLNLNAQTRPVDIVKGAVMVVRRSACEEVGLMDETTQAYGEEADWHYRFRKAGWDVAHIAEAKITHYGQGQASLNLKGWVLIEDRKAVLNYYLKHRPRLQAITVRLVIIFIHTLYSAIWWLPDRSKAQSHWQTSRMAMTFRLKD